MPKSRQIFVTKAAKLNALGIGDAKNGALGARVSGMKDIDESAARIRTHLEQEQSRLGNSAIAQAVSATMQKKVFRYTDGI